MSYRYQPVAYSFGPSLTPAVKWLIIVNAVVYFFQVAAQAFSPALARALVELCGLIPIAVTRGLRIWQPFTYLFLHGSFLHILSNMFVLWMFGCDLERYWGRRRFLFYYFLTGAGAGILNVAVKTLGAGGAVTPGLFTVTIGASGAIYGVLLAFGLLFPDRMIYLWFIIPIPARIFVFIMGAVAFLASLGATGDNISHISHLGGMLIGLIYLRGRRIVDWRLWNYRLRMAYWDWKRRRLQKKFELYMRERDREEHRHDRWVH